MAHVVMDLSSPSLPLSPAQLPTTSGAPVITLNAPTWTSGLLTSVHKLWKENVMCDTNIKCLNNETVTAHSLVLSASSPFLRDFFNKARQGLYTLKMDTVPASLWHYLLEFLYTGSLQLPVSHLFPLYNVANKLQISSLEGLCESYIQNTITGTAKKVVSINMSQVTMCAEENQDLSAPLRTSSSMIEAGTSGDVIQPPPLIALTDQEQAASVPSSEAQVVVKVEPVIQTEDIATVKNISNSQQHQTRDCSSTTTPEPGSHTLINPEITDLSNDGEEDESVSMEVTPGSHGDQDWNQVKLQNVRSLKDTEGSTGEQEQPETVPAGNLESDQMESSQTSPHTPYTDDGTPDEDAADADDDSDEDDLMCKPCNRTFKSKHGLNLHRYSCRKGPLGQKVGGKKYVKVGKMFKCKICSKVFRCYTSIWCHIKFHTGEGLLSCEMCGNQFPSKQLLERHMKYHLKSPGAPTEAPAETTVEAPDKAHDETPPQTPAGQLLEPTTPAGEPPLEATATGTITEAGQRETEEPETEGPKTEGPESSRPESRGPEVGGAEVEGLAAGGPEAGRVDPGEPEAGRVDPGEPEAGRVDPGEPEAGKPETGGPGPEEPETSGLETGRSEAFTPVTEDHAETSTEDSPSGVTGPLVSAAPESQTASIDNATMPMPCLSCDKHFWTHTELKKHEEKEHNKSGDKAGMKFLCNICGRKFNSIVIYKIHMDTHHEQELRTCKVCKQVFRNAKAMYSHSRVHKAGGSQPNPPTPPPSPLTQDDGHFSINRHQNGAQEINEESMDITHEDSAMREADPNDQDMETSEVTGTDNVASNAAALDLTSKEDARIEGNKMYDSSPLHQPSDPVTLEDLVLPEADIAGGILKGTQKQKFQCKHCGKTFRKKGMMVIHLKVHMRQSPHACRLCGRQFAHRGALSRHKEKCLPFSASSLSTATFQEVRQEAREGEDSLAVTNGYYPDGLTDQGDVQKHDDDNNPMDLSVTSTYNTFPPASTSPLNTITNGHVARRNMDIKVTGKDKSAHTYECFHCRKVFPDRRQLYHHTCRDSQGNLIERSYTCKVCHQKFKKSTEFRLHVRSHRGSLSSTYKYECPDCGQHFLTKTAHETHMFSKYKKQISCTKCLKMFCYEVDLAQHIYNYHNGPKPFPCSWCSERFVQKNQLEQHLHACHTPSKSYKCGSCDADFASETELRNHMAVEHDRSPFIAPPLPPAEGSALSENPFIQSINSVPLVPPMEAAERGAAEISSEVSKSSPHSERAPATSPHSSGISFTSQRAPAAPQASGMPYHCECCGEQFLYRNSFIDHLRRLQHQRCRQFYDDKDDGEEGEGEKRELGVEQCAMKQGELVEEPRREQGELMEQLAGKDTERQEREGQVDSCGLMRECETMVNQLVAGSANHLGEPAMSLAL